MLIPCTGSRRKCWWLTLTCNQRASSCTRLDTAASVSDISSCLLLLRDADLELLQVKCQHHGAKQYKGTNRPFHSQQISCRSLQLNTSDWGGRRPLQTNCRLFQDALSHNTTVWPSEAAHPSECVSVGLVLKSQPAARRNNFVAKKAHTWTKHGAKTHDQLGTHSLACQQRVSINGQTRENKNLG